MEEQTNEVCFQHKVMERTLHRNPEDLHFGLGFITNLLCDLDKWLNLSESDSSDIEAK